MHGSLPTLLCYAVTALIYMANRPQTASRHSMSSRMTGFLHFHGCALTPKSKRSGESKLSAFVHAADQGGKENMHHVVRANEMKMEPAFTANSKAFRRCPLVNETVGSVHTGLGLCELGQRGQIDTHLHSFEESFYILEGKPVLELDGFAHSLAPGACGVVPVGMQHAWRN